MATIPAHLILDPLAPLPASLGKKDRERLAELREAYQASMQARFVGADVSTPESAASLLSPLMSSLRVESLVVVGANSRLQTLAPPVIISRGDTDGTDAPIRAILRAVLVMEASQWIMAHNHPTGDPGPSAADRSITRQLVAAGNTVHCPMVDHVIIGAPGRFVSLRRDEPSLWR